MKSTPHEILPLKSIARKEKEKMQPKDFFTENIKEIYWSEKQPF